MYQSTAALQVNEAAVAVKRTSAVLEDRLSAYPAFTPVAALDPSALAAQPTRDPSQAAAGADSDPEVLELRAQLAADKEHYKAAAAARAAAQAALGSAEGGVAEARRALLAAFEAWHASAGALVLPVRLSLACDMSRFRQRSLLGCKHFGCYMKDPHAAFIRDVRASWLPLRCSRHPLTMKCLCLPTDATFHDSSMCVFFMELTSNQCLHML